MQAKKNKGKPKKVGTYKADEETIKAAHEKCWQLKTNLSYTIEQFLHKLISGEYTP